MVKIIYLFLISLCIVLNTHAAENEAKSFLLLNNSVKEQQIDFKEIGLIFGFETIKSCIFSNADYIVLRNYCFPKKKYAAKGYTIISPKYGIVELYEEVFSDTEVKRDIRIENFPKATFNSFPNSLDKLSLLEINNILEKLYNKYLPGCWSTNMSMQTGEPQAACTTQEVIGFEDWSRETQALVNNEKNWTNMLLQLDQKFNQ